ncbi:MAG: mycofactocin precursor MftA [Candidatus Nanopelagicales bacterium]|jgi:mycofactocin precursor|nr:mycofactocin precursor MftA [Candidatus Nanopelagicales bacterium]
MNAEPTTAEPTATEPTEVTVETLIEDVSIDGMCGVY